MVWFAGGHDGGNQETSQVNQLTEQWFERWLRPGRPPPAIGRPFAVSRELGFDPSTGQEQLGVATAPRYPGLAGTRRTAVRLRGPAQTIINPPGGAPPSMSVLPGPGAARSHGRPGPPACPGRAPRSPRPRWPRRCS